jgi:hypothetical protein
VLEAVVLGVRPARALVSGQIAAFVSGANFYNTTHLRCAFDERLVRAVFLSSSLVACIVPSRVAGEADADAVVRVSVASNGQDVAASHATFSYLARCPPGHYCPGLDILPAPNGTFCAGAGLVNFTLCEPGSFQPRAAQSACLPCPVGFYCPDFGLAAPVLCEAGYVCDRRGLRQPRTPCPQGHWCPAGTKTADALDFVRVRRADNTRPETLPDGTRWPGQDEWTLDPEFALLSFDASQRGWTVLTRPYPASGQFLVELPPVGWERAPPGNWSRGGNGTRAPPPLYAERPRACPLGAYCRPGVATNFSEAKNFSTPQPCFAGFFCPRGSFTPEGSGPGPTGFYCPTATEAYICPAGYYCPETGNTRPLPCYPGTYTPLRQQGNCTLCPPGHQCPRWGMLEPELCPAGFICSEFGLSQPVVQCPPGVSSTSARA